MGTFRKNVFKNIRTTINKLVAHIKLGWIYISVKDVKSSRSIIGATKYVILIW
jgi:hypothetical protein